MIYLDPRKIDIFTTSTTINFILENFYRDGIRLCVNRTMWNKERQSRFIESLILKLPVGFFYFDGSDMNKWDIKYAEEDNALLKELYPELADDGDNLDAQWDEARKSMWE